MDWGRVSALDVGARFGGRDLEGPMDLAGLFHGSEHDLEDEDDNAIGALQLLHGWVGPAGPGVALRFAVHADVDPALHAVEVRLRDDARYVRSALPAWRDRHGDLTLWLDLPATHDDERVVLGHLPYAALPRRLGPDLTIEGWLVEDGEPFEEALWAFELPEPGVRRYDNALAAVALAALSSEAAGRGFRGPAAEAALAETRRTGRIEAALARLFSLDATGRATAGALLADAAAEAERMTAARLRARVAPEGLPRVLGLLDSLAGPTPPPGEATFLAALAARLGTTPRGNARPRARGARGMSAAMVAHLQTLDLGPEATWDEVRIAYRRAATTHHPDRALPCEQDAAHERMKTINAAYAALRRRMGRAG